MVTDLVNLIRSEYRKTVAIILRCDSGFFDENNFNDFDDLNIGLIGSGKMYKAVEQQTGEAADCYWNSYDNKEQVDEYVQALTKILLNPRKR